ncbi:MAG: FkbM family methyltransferase [Pseudomonadota bacterium]
MARFNINGVTLDVPNKLLRQKIKEKLTSGEYEGSEARAARMRVKPGWPVLELGGGLGYVSSICAQITEPGNITVVEANPNLIPVIKKNLRLNAASEVTVRHGAVVNNAYPEDTIDMQLGASFWGSSLAGGGGGGGRGAQDIVNVPALKLGPLLREHRPRVVIMDVEGAEARLFWRPWPRFVHHVMLELHPKKYGGATIKRIVDCMSASGLTYDPVCSKGGLLGFQRVAAE